MFPPSSWNVYDATIFGQDRTNNLCEAWNRGFSQLISYNHPSVWTLIDALRKETMQTSTAIEQDALGQLPKKRVKRSTKDMRERLINLCRARRDDTKTYSKNSYVA